MTENNALFRQVMDVAFHVHKDVGPGLLETVYETVLADSLKLAEFSVETQKWVDIKIGNREFRRAFRADMIVNGRLLVEIKSVENLAPVHLKQTLTYTRLLNLPVGMLVNFGGATFKGNVRRVINEQAPAK